MEPKPSRLVVALPFLLSLGFGAFIALPQVRANAVLLATFLVTAGLLLGWAVALSIVFRAKGWTPLMAVSLLKQHYLQACAHTSILVYWGWYWRPVYEHAYLIAAQLIFAYAFDMLLQLSRHRKYTLGFGPFPIIFSINLFLWFKDDWFYYQFLIIAVGLSAKEFLRWTKGGKRVHIFNPSSFPLAIACWVLFFTHRFPITWGEQIAGTQFLPPHIYPFIFLVSLPGQFLFGVTTTTLPAVLSMYLWGQAYLSLTGTYFLPQGFVTIAVFLAMHLLITDPSTSPRTELGRILYGVAYAMTVIVLELTIKPGFPAKLLLVPALNLLVQGIDSATQSKVLRRFDPARIAPQVTGRRRNLAYMAIWAAVFGVMLSLRGIGDRSPGLDLPFWEAACKDHPAHGCPKLEENADLACRRDSGWACNYLGILRHGVWQRAEILRLFSKSCDIGFQPGCDNVERVMQTEASSISPEPPPALRQGPARAGGGVPLNAPPTLADFRILLALYKSSPRTDVDAMTPAAVYAEACRRGWKVACGASF